MSTYEHMHVNSEANPLGWKSAIENWLNQHRPSLENIHGGISNGRDIHMWIRTDDGKGPAVKLTAIPDYDTVVAVEKMLEGGNGVPIGFNISNPPSMWAVLKIN